ncbi:MAG: dipeptide transporter permease DppB [Methanomassiliicoccales archaeon PtaU1.Bin124]|nr:MAG: dipeptide transporter permease DppB [Methanomassiliicoccales archaeon PtaU1.Bin124]
MRLTSFIIKRLLLLIPVLLGVSLLVFVLMGFTGERWTAYTTTDHPKQAQIWAIEEKYHLNESIAVQYYYWLDGIVHGDWGYSKQARMPVTDAISNKFPVTFELALISSLIAVIIGISIGTLSAIKRNKPVDHVVRFVALIGVSLPIFWLALLLLQALYLNLGLAPSGGRISLEFDPSNPLATTPLIVRTNFYTVDSLLMGNLQIFGDVLWHLMLPAICLSFATIALLTRIMRSSMLEVMNLDYVKTARAKGLSEKVVLKKHARRNALIPTTTVVGLAFAGLLGGAVITENIFSLNGLGKWSTAALLSNDQAAILGFTMLIAIIVVLANLIVDIMYAYLDPRVRLE